MTEPARLALPDWPRLMRVEQAAAYLSIGVTELKERGPKAKRHGRRRLYDRRDLDTWADALGGQPLSGAEAERHAQTVSDNFLEERRKRRAGQR